MSNSDSGNNCKIICWVVSALIGLLALFLIKGSVGFLLALLIGVALAFILCLVLPQLFCSAEHDRPQTSAMSAAPVNTPKPAPVTPPPAPKPAAKADVVPAPKAGVASAAANEVEKKSADSNVAAASTPDYDGDGVREGTGEGTRPAALSGPRDGKADDLKQIKGIGPKLEKLLNSLGFYHFDQMANWSANEVAWVDANLQGFKGRVSRDNWTDQAKTLASGGQTEFSKRVEDGDVY